MWKRNFSYEYRKINERRMIRSRFLFNVKNTFPAETDKNGVCFHEAISFLSLDEFRPRDLSGLYIGGLI